MRIGILTHNYPRNSKEQVGAEVFIYWFAHLLKKEGHEVFVFCPDFKGKKDKNKKVPVTWFKWFGGEKKLGNFSLSNPMELLTISLMMLKGSWEVLKFVDKNKIDVTISMWAFPAGFWSMIGKFIKRKPSVAICMGSDIFVYPRIIPAKWLIAFILRSTDLVYGNGYKICEAITRMSGRRSYFFPIAAASLPFKSAKKFEVDNKKFNFLYVGRLEKVKGPDILIEAVRIVKEKNKKFHVYLAGPGTMYEELKKKVKEYDLIKNVTLLGHVEHGSKLAGLFLACDSLVMASRSESTPFTVIEAIFARLPMVVTTAGDMGIICKDFKLGYISPTNDPHKLADAMYKALKEGEEFKKKRYKNFKKPQEIYDTVRSTKLVLEKIENKFGKLEV